jgi:hypothetical protein
MGASEIPVAWGSKDVRCLKLVLRAANPFGTALGCFGFANLSKQRS